MEWLELDVFIAPQGYIVLSKNTLKNLGSFKKDNKVFAIDFNDPNGLQEATKQIHRRISEQEK